MTLRHLILVLPVLIGACGSPSPAPSATSPATTAVDAGAAAIQTPAPVASAAKIEPKAAPKPQAEKLMLKRLVLARGVVNKEPLDPSTSFNAKESKVYAFVEVENPEKLPGEVSVSFEPPKGKPQGEVKLAVGEGAHWRTWAFTRQAHEAGEWTAIVKDARGHELGRQTFEVQL